MSIEDRVKLIGPISLGETVAGEWEFAAVEPVPGRGASRFLFRSAAGDLPTVEITATPLNERQTPIITERFAVGVRNADSSPVRGRSAELLDLVVGRIRSNERDVPSVGGMGEGSYELPPGPVLHLIPGHLGDPLDLSLRALMVLARTPTVFLEAGSVDGARQLLWQFNIDADSKDFVEIAPRVPVGPSIRERLTRLFEEREHACLFGVDEGVPGFCDPGSELVAEAQQQGIAVRSIGGPSSISQALSRLDVALWEFQCLGRLESVTDVRRVCRLCGDSVTLPVLLLADGRACRELLPGVLRRRRWSRGWIASELTTADEALISFDGRAESIPDHDILPDRSRVVVVLVPEPLVLDAWGLRRLLKRLINRR